MTTFDWDQLRRDKDEFHQRAARRSFGEKLTQLDRLRERAQVLKRAAGASPAFGSGAQHTAMELKSRST